MSIPVRCRPVTSVYLNDRAYGWRTRISLGKAGVVMKLSQGLFEELPMLKPSAELLLHLAILDVLPRSSPLLHRVS